MAFSSLRHQWHHPSGVFSVLLIVRGDVIQKAVAQLAGGAFNITPVAFSFGWVSFGVSTLLSVIGEGKLMPEVDCPSIVVNVGNGYRRTNSSWVLGRVLRDQELSFSSEYANPALVVTIFNASGENNIQVSSRVSQQTNPTNLERAEQPTDGRAKKQQGVPVLDLVWSMGMIVMFVQCMVAAVPGIVKKDWLIFTVALGGTLLALAGGALPQWREEKWSCRKLDECDAVQENLPMSKTIILTRGNGHRHVLVICSDGTGLNLEDLAAARIPRNSTTLPLVIILAICWIILLLMVSNLSENVWYLVAVGGLGMVQNHFAAGHCRDPSALGIHLDKSDTVLPDKPEKDKNGAEIKNKVFQVLKKTEKRMSETYGVRKVGILLLPVFFPDGLRPHEIAWRREEEAKYDKIDEVAGIYKRDENEKHSDGPRTSGKIGQDSAWAERPSSGAIAHRHRHAAEHSKETVQDAV